MLVAVILQSTVFPLFQIRSGRADIIFMMILTWTLLAGADQGIVWAMVGGSLQDLLTGVPIGASALALVIVMFIIGRVVGEVGRGNLLIPPLAAGLGTGLYHVLLIGIYAVLGWSTPFGYNLLNVTLPTAALNVVLILPIYRLMGLVFEATRPRRVSL